MNEASKFTNFTLLVILGFSIARFLVLLSNPGFWIVVLARLIVILFVFAALLYLFWPLIENFFNEPPSEDI